MLRGKSVVLSATVGPGSNPPRYFVRSYLRGTPGLLGQLGTHDQGEIFHTCLSRKSATAVSVQEYNWLLAKGIRAENIAATGQSIGGNFAVSLAIELRNKGVAMPAAILSVSAWCDIELKNDAHHKQRQDRQASLEAHFGTVS